MSRIEIEQVKKMLAMIGFPDLRNILEIYMSRKVMKVRVLALNENGKPFPNEKGDIATHTFNIEVI